VLIRSTPASALAGSTKVKDDVDKPATDVEPSGKERVLSLRLSGPFTSAFPESSPGGLERSSAESAVFLVGDSALLNDPFILPRNNRKSHANPINSNARFFLNIVEQLVDVDLIATPASGEKNRPSARVDLRTRHAPLSPAP
jgi:hypothetical protein